MVHVQGTSLFGHGTGVAAVFLAGIEVEDIMNATDDSIYVIAGSGGSFVGTGMV